MLLRGNGVWLWRFFNKFRVMKGFYINLDHRTDRRAEVEKELEG